MRRARPGRARCGPHRRTARVCRSRGTGTSGLGSARTRPWLASGCSAGRVAYRRGGATSRMRARSRIAAQQSGRKHPAAEHVRRRCRALRGRRTPGSLGRCRSGGGIDGFLVGDHVHHGVLGRLVVGGSRAVGLSAAAHHRGVIHRGEQGVGAPLVDAARVGVTHAARQLLHTAPRSRLRRRHSAAPTCWWCPPHQRASRTPPCDSTPTPAIGARRRVELVDQRVDRGLGLATDNTPQPVTRSASAASTAAIASSRRSDTCATRSCAPADH